MNYTYRIRIAAVGEFEKRSPELKFNIVSKLKLKTKSQTETLPPGLLLIKDLKLIVQRSAPIAASLHVTLNDVREHYTSRGPWLF